MDLETLSSVYVPSSGTHQVSMFPAVARAGFPVLLHEMSFHVPPPGDGSDPYAEWRHELSLPNAVFERRLP